jgi:hypothetical protein
MEWIEAKSRFTSGLRELTGMLGVDGDSTHASAGREGCVRMSQNRRVPILRS